MNWEDKHERGSPEWLCEMHVQGAGARLRAVVEAYLRMSEEERKVIDSCIRRVKRGLPNAVAPIERSMQDHRASLLPALRENQKRETARKSV
jgi:hypothetical protein